MRSYCQCSPKPTALLPTGLSAFPCYFLSPVSSPSHWERERTQGSVGGTFPFSLTQAEMGADLKITFLLYASSFILVHIAGQTWSHSAAADGDRRYSAGMNECGKRKVRCRARQGPERMCFLHSFPTWCQDTVAGVYSLPRLLGSLLEYENPWALTSSLLWFQSRTGCHTPVSCWSLRLLRFKRVSKGSLSVPASHIGVMVIGWECSLVNFRK